MAREWKNRNEEYLRELQILLDTIDNVSDENLKDRIIHQFLKCDNVLTEIAEDLFYIYYTKGKNEQMKE